MIQKSCPAPSARIPKRLSALKLLLAIAFGLAFSQAAPAAEEEEAEAEAKYSRGSRMCLACHGEGRAQDAHEILKTRMGTTADPAAPMAEGNHGCESCHGPSAAHTKRSSDGTRPPPAITLI